MRILSQAAGPVSFALAALALVVVPVCHAATWSVPSQVPTIAAALDSARTGDTVTVECGTYFEHDLVIRAAVRLQSTALDPSCVTIDAQGLGRILDCVGDDAEIVGITFTGGKAATPGNFDNGGGAIRAVGVAASITDCAFVANSATFGGALGFLQSGSFVSDCTFTNNTATGPGWAVGGAVYCELDDPELEHCTFTGNTAFSATVPGDGGAVFAKWTRTRITDCTFIDNHAGAGAGAFYSYYSDRSVVSGCRFEQNGASAGGALYLEDSEASFADCTYVENHAPSGGAVYMEVGSTSSFTRCAFTENESTVFAGGAIDVWFSSPTFVECDFLDNSSFIDGGAVAMNASTVASFTDCVFGRNVALADGGALRARQTANVTIAGTSFVANAAGGSGGGVFAEGVATVQMERSLLAFSTAGAGAACAGSALLTLQCSDVFGNAGGDWVGCLAPQASSDGNFEVDPSMCDLTGDDFGVSHPDSPCLPENNACGVVVGASSVACGCPSGATVLVPSDFPTIEAALAAAVPGDVVGVCSGTWPETIDVRDGVHLLGLGGGLTRVEWPMGATASALVRARGVADSTAVVGFTFDGVGAAPSVVSAGSTSTGLHLASNVITGGFDAGIRNGPDSRVVIGGALELANDIFGNGVATARNVWNENVTADSLEATLNYWGTQAYDVILDAIEGPVRTCPITEITHTLSLCAPLSAVSAPDPTVGGIRLAIGPNPFRDATSVTFASLTSHGRGRVQIYDVRGRCVATLFEGDLVPGPNRVRWAGRDGEGRSVAPGVYFVRLELGEDRFVRKVVRLR